MCAVSASNNNEQLSLFGLGYSSYGVCVQDFPLFIERILAHRSWHHA